MNATPAKDAETLNSDTWSHEMNQPILRIISAFFKPFSQMLTLSPIRSGFSTLDRSSQAVTVRSLRTLGGGVASSMHSHLLLAISQESHVCWEGLWTE